jgi:hypothetical protein
MNTKPAIRTDAALRVIRACERIARKSQSTCIVLSRTFLSKLLDQPPVAGDLAELGQQLLLASGLTAGPIRVHRPLCSDARLALQMLVPLAADKEAHVMSTYASGRVRCVATRLEDSAAEEVALVARLAVELGLVTVTVAAPWPPTAPEFKARAALFAAAVAAELDDDSVTAMAGAGARYVSLRALTARNHEPGARTHLIVDAAHMLGTAELHA